MFDSVSFKKAVSITGAFTLALQATTALAVDGATVPNFVPKWEFKLPGSWNHPTGAGHGNIKVDACIVDLWDTSQSVTLKRFELEREAYARALESEEFGSALKKLPNKRIAMNIAFFDSSAKRITPEWVVVDIKSRFDLAEKIRKTGRRGAGHTMTDKGISFALYELQKCKSERPIIDIVTDGKTNFPQCTDLYECEEGKPIANAARDEAAARGVTINVLAIQIETSKELKKWAIDHLATQNVYDQEKRGLHMAFGKEATQGKVFTLDGIRYADDEEAWIEKFKQMRVRKLIEEMAEWRVEFVPG